MKKKIIISIIIFIVVVIVGTVSVILISNHFQNKKEKEQAKIKKELEVQVNFILDSIPSETITDIGFPTIADKTISVKYQSNSLDIISNEGTVKRYFVDKNVKVKVILTKKNVTVSRTKSIIVEKLSELECIENAESRITQIKFTPDMVLASKYDDLNVSLVWTSMSNGLTITNENILKINLDELNNVNYLSVYISSSTMSKTIEIMVLKDKIS